MPNLKSGWYLTYLEYDPDRPRDTAITQTKIPLGAKCVEVAAFQARSLWTQRMNSGTYKGGNGQEYPQRPRLVYEAALFEEEPLSQPIYFVSNYTQ